MEIALNGIALVSMKATESRSPLLTLTVCVVSVHDPMVVLVVT